MDNRSLSKRKGVAATAIDRVMSARRSIVDVRFDRKDEDELLALTSEILDRLEAFGTSLADESDTPSRPGETRTQRS